MNKTTEAHCDVQFKHVLAFEVAKAELVTKVLPSGRQIRIPNTSEAVRNLIKQEQKANARLDLGPLLVICEATGSYDRHILEAAAALGVACHRAHGSRMRAYARYRGRRAKTDPIDVGLIAEFGRDTPGLAQWQKPSAAQEELKALVSRRSELNQALGAERTRLQQTTNKAIIASLRRQIRSLEKEIETIEAALERLVAETEKFDVDVRLMRSVIGIGFISAVSVLAYLPEIGRVGRGTIAAIAGTAPYDNASGARDGTRHIAGGRKDIRNVLFMAGVAAMRFNPHLSDLAARIKAKGRPPKVAITAVMRKLLVILNAVVRDGRPCMMPSAARPAA